MTYKDVFAGYEANRERLRGWLRRHYIEEFGLEPGRLLDAGCGNGFWSDLFRAEGFHVRGIDSNAELIADARSKYPGINFAVKDVEEPLANVGKYDVVFARTLPQFYAPVLSKARIVTANLLKHVEPGGLLLISVYSDGSGLDKPQLVEGHARHHSDQTFLRAIGEVGAITRSVRVANYLQMAVVPS